MRGDSLRDLYAKTLALVGLGLLAGAGALVDYWPVGVELPHAASALRLPARATARAVPSFDSPTRTGLQPVAVAAVAAPATWRHASFVSLPVTPASDTVTGQTVVLSGPIMRTAAVDALPGSERTSPFATLTEPADDEMSGSWEPPPSVAVAEESGDGLITGAFKKTGASIVTASVKTGSSIVDAMRAVGGAVRKALPN
jgi:hypothetical protein